MSPASRTHLDDSVDVIDLRPFGGRFRSLDDVLAHSTEFANPRGITTVVDLGDPGVVMLANVAAASLTPAHFVFG